MQNVEKIHLGNWKWFDLL